MLVVGKKMKNIVSIGFFVKYKFVALVLIFLVGTHMSYFILFGRNPSTNNNSSSSSNEFL